MSGTKNIDKGASMEIEIKSNNPCFNIKYTKTGVIGDLADRIDDVIEWLKNKDIKVDVSRYSRYKQYILDFCADSEKNKGKILLMSDLESMFDKSSEAIREIYQIVAVFDAFKNEESKIFDEKLKKIIVGKDFYEGDENDSGRDFLYELFIAAWYKRKGFDIVFESEILTDVIARNENSDVYIECKRLKSSNGYEANYKKGCKQLRKVKNKDAIKLVYIDIYNCLKKHLIPFEYSNFLDIEQYIKQCVNIEFKKNNAHITNRILKDYNGIVDGVVFTAVGVFGVNNSDGIESDIYVGSDVIIDCSVSDERFDLIKKALGRVNN